LSGPSLSRKGLLAVAGASLVAACGGEDEDAREREARTAADLEIVRFLLSVEHVTSAFWEEVVARDALAEVEQTSLAQSIARNESEHVEVLRRYERRLAKSEAPAPTPNFAEIFAAGPQEILRSSATVANIAAAGYLGQCNRIQDRNVLASVLAIHTVEGRQAAALNRAAGNEDGVLPGGAFAEPMNMTTVRHRLKRFAS
jgi:hypothetical protein